MSKIQKVGAYEVGYSKGQSAVLNLVRDRIVNSDRLYSEFRSKKQYRDALKAILNELAKDSYKREKFILTGDITLKVTKDGEVTLV